MKHLCCLLLTFCSLLAVQSQDNLYTRYTTAAERVKLYRNLINNSINRNLSVALTDSTEDKWEEAFGALELLLYKNMWVDGRIKYAFDSIQNHSPRFQRALLELAYTNYPSTYIKEANELLLQTTDPKIYAMCAEYIMQQKRDSATLDSLEELTIKKFTDDLENPVLKMLAIRILNFKFPSAPIIQTKFFTDFFDKNYLPGQVVMYSLQRNDRDYPGIVIIRGRDGKFIRDSTGKIFNVRQLARSITNLPGYLTNGNTPQGIFRMHGFDVSRSNFIGPSPNIQLSMPVEVSLQKFFNDSTIEDSVWSTKYYERLLPATLKNYFPLYHSYYAGLAGRTEIIAHGTTINPEYYKTKIFYPLTPTQGCLCTKEIWDGKRMETDQQKLVYALLKAGGAYGYCLVLELDNKKEPVSLNEILPYISQGN